MTSGLSIGSPSVDKSPEITPQQERTLEVEQNRANLGNIEQKVDAKLASNDTFAQYPEEAKGIVKNALMEECYVRFGKNPNTTNVGAYFNAASKEHSIEVTVDQFLSVSLNPEKVLENYKLTHPEFDLEGAKLKFSELGKDMDEKRAFTTLTKEVDALQGAVEKATNNRNQSIEHRNEEIENAGAVKRFLGKAPDPIPNISEVPLTRDEIAKYVKPEFMNSENFQRLLGDYVYRTNEKLDHNHYVVDIVGEKTFFANHPFIANAVGQFSRGSTNMTTDAIRYSTHGHDFSDRENKIKVGEPRILSVNLQDLSKQTEGTEVNAFRHTLWQAMITSEYSTSIAKEVGDSHEKNPLAHMSLDVYTKNFSTLLEADEVIDLLNNEIGRKIGSSEKNLSRQDLALKVLEEFHENGLYVAKPTENGEFRIERGKISDAQYNYLNDLFKQLDNDGVCVVNPMLNNSGECATDEVNVSKEK